MANRYLSLFLTCIAIALGLSACGVGNVINEMKIKTSPESQAVEETSECDFNEYRIARTLAYINRVRSEDRTCGNELYHAAPSVSWDGQLYSAAQVHSEDMSIYDEIGHEVARNSTSKSRIDDSGYNWSSFSENVAGGLNSPELAIDKWVASPGHCINIMNPSHTQIGMACAINNASSYRTYWTLLLATPEKR
ncbi:MAG: CAP domain-containing protein [Pseudomonadota bacterium]